MFVELFDPLLHNNNQFMKSKASFPFLYFYSERVTHRAEVSYAHVFSNAGV